MMSTKKIVILKVDEGTKLSQIAKAFAIHFPYLSLRFFMRIDVPRQDTDDKNILDMNSVMQDLVPNFKSSQIYFHEELSVADLEQLVKDQLGLNAQVYRKYRDIWLLTWATETWSLAEQNSRGELLNQF